MSDGGEGFGRVVGALIGARTRRTSTRDAAGRPVRARWWWEPRSRTAVVESAEVVGLARLPAGRFHPFDLDTAGLAGVLAAVARMAPRRTFVGVGGSATNDGGFGFARALGWRFLSRTGAGIRRWIELGGCAHVEPPDRGLGLGRLSVGVDVRNPLLGARGSTRVFGPQKGIRPEEFAGAETALRRLARVTAERDGRTLAAIPGAGAAGGLGFGLMAFLGAEPEPGFALFSRAARLPERIRQADLVITGEGRLDDQSLMGKGIGELARLSQKAGVPVVAICGSIDRAGGGQGIFTRTYSLSAVTSRENALERPRYWLARAAECAGREYGRT